MDGANRGGDCPSEALRHRNRAWTHAAVWCQGCRHQRVFPRSRWIPDGVHVLCFAKRGGRMSVLHDPTMLPADLPVPEDDGGARHLTGRKLPALTLVATDGSSVDLSPLAGRTLL